MLIESHRHTAKDLELWREYDNTDSLHIKSHGFFERCQRVKDSINAFHRRPKPYHLSVSWGKDSVVLLHFFLSLGFRPHVVHIRMLDNENPESINVRDAFLKRFSFDYEEICYSYADADETWFSDGRPVKWYRTLSELQKKHGVHVTGVRADESARRMLRFRSHGIETRWSFAPFSFFTGLDVFAYLKMHDLPTHPNYAMLGDGRWDRDFIRVNSLGNKEGDGGGRAEWEREYYGDVLRRIEAGTIR